MNIFEEASLRLKQQLKVTEDKQVAQFLGLTADAWVKRKNRDAFPEKEVYALAAKRPELQLDVTYVLTGRHAQAADRQALDSTAAVVPQMEPQGGPITEKLQAAYRQAGSARSLPEYASLLTAIDDCSPADLLLLRAMAEWCVQSRR